MYFIKKFKSRVIIKYDSFGKTLFQSSPMEEKQSFLKQKIDLESPNKNIVPITTSIGDDGKLSVGGCSIE